MTARSWTAALLLISALLAVEAVGSPLPGGTVQEPAAPADDPAALFQEANGLYQANEFQRAAEAYEAIRARGYRSGDLYFNLGNAYFKTGDLGPSILNYERALRLDPGDPDTRANLELARSLTADAIQPMPRFWVLSAVDWWVNLLPRRILALVVALAWLAGMGGLCIRILGRSPGTRTLSTWTLGLAGGIFFLLGITFLARQGHLGGAEWGIIMSEEVAVQSAPSPEDDLTLFQVHEGTKVRLDQHTADWSEIVLEDGRVGWVPSGSLEEI